MRGGVQVKPATPSVGLSRAGMPRGPGRYRLSADFSPRIEFLSPSALCLFSHSCSSSSSSTERFTFVSRSHECNPTPRYSPFATREDNSRFSSRTPVWLYDSAYYTCALHAPSRYILDICLMHGAAQCRAWVRLVSIEPRLLEAIDAYDCSLRSSRFVVIFYQL